ncbi:hypothetical protein [uncultured Lamprocystis sp.]|jgi:ATP-dependent DNA helicase RecG|uniref:hypothetical protein n=1 Tax=uncultured Lamprocystis sp. TaxID=543132 RepID=UPI0025F2311E|nr:hypothetical protein [uncultured Lamprocystis sp.]
MTEQELYAVIAEHEADRVEFTVIERRVSHAKTFDAQPCLGSQLADLSQPLFLIDYRLQAVAPEVIAENNRSVEHQLASLRFFDLSHGCPTHGGILLFGLDVRAWLPGAYIQFLRVGGDSLDAEILNDQTLYGDLLSVLRELDGDAEALPQPDADGDGGAQARVRTKTRGWSHRCPRRGSAQCL